MFLPLVADLGNIAQISLCLFYTSCRGSLHISITVTHFAYRLSSQITRHGFHKHLKIK